MPSKKSKYPCIEQARRHFPDIDTRRRSVQIIIPDNVVELLEIEAKKTKYQTGKMTEVMREILLLWAKEKTEGKRG